MIRENEYKTLFEQQVKNMELELDRIHKDISKLRELPVDFIECPFCDLPSDKCDCKTKLLAEYMILRKYLVAVEEIGKQKVIS